MISFCFILGPPVNNAYLYEAQQARRKAALQGSQNKSMKMEEKDEKQDHYVSGIPDHETEKTKL